MVKRNVSLVLFYDKEGRILLQDRSKMRKNKPVFGFFGGKSEGEETPEDTLKRELMEELELRIENYYFLTEQHIVRNDTGNHVTRFLFLAPMPDIDKLVVHEGDLFLTTFEEAFGEEMLQGHHDLLKKAQDYIKSTK